MSARHLETAEEIVALCTNPSEDCFKSNPSALSALFYYDDGLLRRHWQNIGVGARDAAVYGVPIESMTFKKANLVGPNWDARIIDHGTGNYSTLRPDSIETEVATCAYACGKAAAGQCSVFVPIETQTPES